VTAEHQKVGKQGRDDGIKQFMHTNPPYRRLFPWKKMSVLRCRVPSGLLPCAGSKFACLKRLLHTVI